MASVQCQNPACLRNLYRDGKGALNVSRIAGAILSDEQPTYHEQRR